MENEHIVNVYCKSNTTHKVELTENLQPKIKKKNNNNEKKKTNKTCIGGGQHRSQ